MLTCTSFFFSVSLDGNSKRASDAICYTFTYLFIRPMNAILQIKTALINLLNDV